MMLAARAFFLRGGGGGGGCRRVASAPLGSISIGREKSTNSFSTDGSSSSSPSSSSPLKNNNSSLLMGCVCYDPAVGDIWTGIKNYLIDEAKVPFDYVLFTNYEAQVNSLLNGHIDIAWNGPIAHVMVEQGCPPEKTVVSLGMRDVDRDFESIVVIRKDCGISTLEDLNGKRLLTGASDSPQAHVVPLHYLHNVAGLKFQSIISQDLDLGKHGDTSLGEVKALEELLVPGVAPAAVVSKMMWERGLAGMLPSVNASVLASTCEELNIVDLPKFDHCQFDALLNSTGDNEKEAKLNDFGEALFAMDWENPKHQHLLKLEGIQRQWVGPRQSGYDIVRNAMHRGTSYRTATNFHYRGGSGMGQQQARSFSTSSSSSSSSSSNPRVAVIGAGVAGIQVLRAFRGAGLNNVTALEASDKVGGLWNSNYSNFGVQVQKQLYEFPDYPMTSVKWGDYANGPQVQAYTESFVDDFGLRESIRFNTKVKKVEQDSNTAIWKVETIDKDGKSEESTYDYLVVATGLYSNRNKSFPAVLKGQPNVVHSCDFCDASVAKGKGVVVVGSGKSAVDCAIEAVKAGASSVTMIQRKTHWPTPQKIAGLIPFQYIFLSRFGEALVSAHTAPFPGGSGKIINAFSNSVIGPLLVKPVFRAVEELFAFQFGLRGELRPKQDVVKDLYDVALILDSEYKQMRQSGKIKVHIGEIDEYDGASNVVKLKNGSKLDGVDLIVTATGFEQDYSIFDEKVRNDLGCSENDDGLYMYRYILPEKVPNLAFIGHMASISNISTYGLQSEWLARHLKGTLTSSIPSQEEIHDEIETRKKWARSFIPRSNRRGMLAMLHQTHYHDQLLRDMGENPHRKMPNILAEMLMPYEPADYNGIIGGELLGRASATNNVKG